MPTKPVKYSDVTISQRIIFFSMQDAVISFFVGQGSSSSVLPSYNSMGLLYCCDFCIFDCFHLSLEEVTICHLEDFKLEVTSST